MSPELRPETEQGLNRSLLPLSLVLAAVLSLLLLSLSWSDWLWW